MLRFLTRLFRSDARADQTTKGGDAESTVEFASRSPKREASDRYFQTLLRMQTAISANDFDSAARLVRLNLRYIPDWVDESCRRYGSLEVSSIPALQQGGTILALAGDQDGLTEMGEIVTTIVELGPWTDSVKQHLRDLRLFSAILDAVAKYPRCLQTEVKGLVGEADGRRVATLISYLERAGKIVRIRKGRTYEIVLPGSPFVPKAPPKRNIGSHRTDRRDPELREIDLSALSYVPLPPAPPSWEEAVGEVDRANVPTPESHFEIHDADWRIESIENIPLAERPDPAFRQLHPNASGLLMIDDLGKAEGLGNIDAAALLYDRAGSLVAKAGLQHGTYRVGVHPLGRGLIAMSRDCAIHAYDDRLALILETALAEAPEIQALKRRFNISGEKLKNHIRCVALSADARRYLFTAVDEAWCVGLDGQGLWGAKLPLKAGWTRVATPTSIYQTSAEVEQALEVMGLSLPIDPNQVKRRYRSLAKKWHPDLNPGVDQSHEKMKALNLAAEALSGIKASSLPRYTGAEFVQEEELAELEIDRYQISMTAGIVAGEIHASDWIYAACFGAKSGTAYLAGYSGRVVQVDENGKGVRAYDIGSVPRRIVDTGEYLYLLTDTRLYILRGDQLVNLMDTFEAGDLVVAQTGFGLLETKRIRWYREDGHSLGAIVAKHPIRRVYSADEGMIVETRQRRAIVRGVPAF